MGTEKAEYLLFKNILKSFSQIPFYIGSASDLRRARPYCSDLHFVVGSLNGGSSLGGLSVVTQPYRVVTGPCAAMDVYAEDEEDFKAHAKVRVAQKQSSINKSFKKGKTSLA